MKKQAIKSIQSLSQFSNLQALSKNQMNLVKGGGDGDGDYIGAIDDLTV